MSFFGGAKSIVGLDIGSSCIKAVELKKSLENLLVFSSGDGCTNANCWAVDLFFCVGEGWERDWAEQGLPDDFHDVLSPMG